MDTQEGPEVPGRHTEEPEEWAKAVPLIIPQEEELPPIMLKVILIIMNYINSGLLYAFIPFKKTLLLIISQKNLTGLLVCGAMEALEKVVLAAVAA